MKDSSGKVSISGAEPRKITLGGHEGKLEMDEVKLCDKLDEWISDKPLLLQAGIRMSFRKALTDGKKVNDALVYVGETLVERFNPGNDYVIAYAEFLATLENDIVLPMPEPVVKKDEDSSDASGFFARAIAIFRKK